MAKRFRRRRLTKKELKQDQFVESAMSVLSGLRKHGTKIGVGAVLIIFLLIASFYYFQSKRRTALDAIADLSAATALYSTGDFPNAIPRLQNHLLQYGGTKSGAKALYFLANARYFQGNFDGALQDFKRFLERSPDDPLLSPSAQMGTAACYEQIEEWWEAAEGYEEVRKRYPESVLVPEALVSAGRCFEKIEDWDEAERVYKEVIETYPEKAFSADAETYLALLIGKRAVLQKSPQETKPLDILKDKPLQVPQ